MTPRLDNAGALPTMPTAASTLGVFTSIACAAVAIIHAAAIKIIAAVLESLDDDHATAVARARLRERLGLVGVGAAAIAGFGLRSVETLWLRVGTPATCRQMKLVAAQVLETCDIGRSAEEGSEVLDPLHIVTLGLWC
jgi:hypothetical protein